MCASQSTSSEWKSAKWAFSCTRRRIRAKQNRVCLGKLIFAFIISVAVLASCTRPHAFKNSKPLKRLFFQCETGTEQEKKTPNLFTYLFGGVSVFVLCEGVCVCLFVSPFMHYFRCFFCCFSFTAWDSLFFFVWCGTESPSVQLSFTLIYSKTNNSSCAVAGEKGTDIEKMHKARSVRTTYKSVHTFFPCSVPQSWLSSCIRLHNNEAFFPSSLHRSKWDEER